MSGDDVTLYGPAMVALVRAIPQVEEMLKRPIVLVGGLAVLSRLGSAYRVTSDPLTLVDEPSSYLFELTFIAKMDTNLTLIRSPICDRGNSPHDTQMRHYLLGQILDMVVSLLHVPTVRESRGGCLRHSDRLDFGQVRASHRSP